MRVGIIGGGITGLTLADELAGAGADVELFERGGQFGGLAAGFDVLPGIKLECFYHHIFKTDNDIRALMDDLGIAEKLEWHPAETAFFIDGSVHRLSTPIDVLRFKALGFGDRLILAATMLELRERRSGRRLERITVEEYFRRRSARNVYRTIWEPMYRAKWGDSAPHISAAWMWQKIRARGKSRRGMHEELGYPHGGFGEIATALVKRATARGAAFHANTTVERIAIGPRGVTGIDLGDRTSECDAVVSTLPLPNLVPLVRDGGPESLEQMRSIRYRGVVCHVIVMDRPLSSIYWLNIADRSIPLGGIVEHTNLVPKEHYRGRSIAYLFNYLSQDAPELEMEEEAFAAHHFPHVKRIFPNFSEDHVENRFVFRTRLATPVYQHPYSAPPLEPVRGLFLADTSRIFPMDRGTSECVRLARYVAGSMLGRDVSRPGPI